MSDAYQNAMSIILIIMIVVSIIYVYQIPISITHTKAETTYQKSNLTKVLITEYKNEHSLTNK